MNLNLSPTYVSYGQTDPESVDFNFRLSLDDSNKVIRLEDSTGDNVAISVSSVDWMIKALNDLKTISEFRKESPTLK